jgi:hypothetical protein
MSSFWRRLLRPGFRSRSSDNHLRVVAVVVGVVSGFYIWNDAFKHLPPPPGKQTQQGQGADAASQRSH